MAGQAGGGEGAASRELELELELCGELLPSASAVFIVVAPSRIETNKFVRWCHMAMTAAAAEAAAKDFPGYF